MSAPIRVLVVDDSAFVRKFVRDALAGAADIEVVGHAGDGLEALELIEELRPDVVTLDLHMPELDGLGVLAALPHEDAPRVLVVTTVDTEAEEAIRALELGAIDVLRKPTPTASVELYEIRSELVAKVRVAAEAVPRRSEPSSRRTAVEPGPPPSKPALDVRPAPTSILVIGTSTGGPQALTRLLPALPADLRVPVALALHIPEGFTRGLAERLDAMSRVRVFEAWEGLVLSPGEVAIAQAGQHLHVSAGSEAGTVRCHLSSKPATMHRPSVDELFASAARAFGPAALGLVLTGMGNDGLAGARAIRRAGGRVFTEAESSCVVYGMPRAVFEEGLSTAQLALSDIAPALVAAVASS